LLETPTPPDATGVPTSCCENPCDGYSDKADKAATAAVESFILVLYGFVLPAHMSTNPAERPGAIDDA
jgi:hypothetical protein